ncbi:AAA-like domain-containing protein [Nostoc punctiforme UO1]|uniref:AAA-like domain-containing protein n=1 Tax=Nostoc punctiforme TaxID=272131 RepID=UPI0030B42AF7
MSDYSYYQAGGSLSYEHSSYVKRQADEKLYQWLKEGNVCYVFNCRQMGKSSLRVQTMNRLGKEGIRCASIDMSIIDKHPNNFYKDIVNTLVDGFDLLNSPTWSVWYQQHQGEWRMQDLILFVEKVLMVAISQKTIIFIDEIDNLVNVKFKNDFFNFIRACNNKRADNPEYQRITFCLLGVVTPSDLTDRNGTPFNIGKSIELTGFKFEEARESLTKGLIHKVDNPEKLLKQVLHWTGGQPFLTQKLCNLLFENAKTRKPNIKYLVQEYIINDWEIQDNPEHLRTIKNRILDDNKTAYRLLKIYKKILEKGEIDADDNSEQMKLRLSGLVVKQQQTIRVYNPIYQEVFSKEWVNNKLRTELGFLSFLKSNCTKYTVLIPVAILLAIISATSLIISYIFIDSKAWNDSFNPSNLGVVIEFFRTCILLLIALIIIGNIFNKEAEDYINSIIFTDRRRLTLIIGTIILIIIAIQHFYIGPNELCKEHNFHNFSENIYFHECLLPYIWYLPCSIINYICIGIPLGSLYIHVAIEDCRELREKRIIHNNFFNKNKSEVTSIEQDLHKTQEQVRILYRHFYNQTKRHINVVAIMIFIVSIDVLFLSGTLSKSGYIWVRFFYIFWFVAPILITVYFAFSEYEKIIETTINFFSDYGIDETLIIETKYKSFNLLNEIITSNIFLRIIVVLLPILYYFFYNK